MTMLLGISGQGMLSRTVFPNRKCESCLHYEANKSMSGVCAVGQQPAGCGTGSDPLRSFAPYTPQTPKSLIEHLGDKHLGMVKSIVSDLQTLMRSHCPRHSDGGGFYSEEACRCGTVARSLVCDGFWQKLPNRVRAVTTREEADEFVMRAMTPVAPSSDAAKTPPGVYLPGVHDPKSPMRYGKKGKPKPTTTTATSTTTAKGGAEEGTDILDKAVSELEEAAREAAE